MSSEKKKSTEKQAFDSQVHLDDEYDWPTPPNIIIQTGHCPALEGEDNEIFTNHSEALIHYGNYINHLNTTMRSVTRSLLKGHKLLFAKVEEVLEEVKGIKTEVHKLDDRVSHLEEHSTARASWWGGMWIEVRRAVITGIIAAFFVLLGAGVVAFVQDVGQQADSHFLTLENHTQSSGE